MGDIHLYAYVDDTHPHNKFHCVVLNGFLCSMFEELDLSVTRRPWKEFLLWIIGSDEAHLPLLLKDIADAQAV
jgi:hypothetical protein